MSADKRSLAEISRQDLYDLIWSMPVTKVCEEFGVSDVAVAKRCRKMNIPLPPRGYWAKPPARRRRKPPLPPTPAEVFAQAAQQPIHKSLSLPETTDDLHSLASELLRALNAAKADSQKMVNIRERTLPEVRITKALVERVAKAFHVLLKYIEPLGVPFCKTQSSYDGGYFRKGHDRLYLKIEEEFVEKLGSSGRRSSWHWQMQSSVPSGYLTFIMKTGQYSRDEKRWEESEKMPLEAVLSQIVQEIRRHFLEVQERREREAVEQAKQREESERRWKEHQEKEAIRMQEEKQRKHHETLEMISQKRVSDLIKASEWWRLHQNAQEFIATCEQRWRGDLSGQLTLEQEEWLKWARETVATLSPFEVGYPEPGKDGFFDQRTVPLGGSYPVPRDFPQPPTMPVIPAPVVVQQGFEAQNHRPDPKPYPFWLKYPRR